MLHSTKPSLILTLFLFPIILFAQDKFYKELVITSPFLELKAAPDTLAQNLQKLKDGELVSLIEIENPIKDSTEYDFFYRDTWLKVKSEKGKIGYILISNQGVESPFVVYENGESIRRLYQANYYGIFISDRREFELKKVNPSQSELWGDLSIEEKENCPLILATHKNLVEGSIESDFWLENIEGGYEFGTPLSAGTRIEIFHHDQISYEIWVTANYALGESGPEKQNYQLHLAKKGQTNTPNSKYSAQNLTNLLNGFSMSNPVLLFAGDLDQDGLPDLVIREDGGDTRVNHLFLSSAAVGEDFVSWVGTSWYFEPCR